MRLLLATCLAAVAVFVGWATAVAHPDPAPPTKLSVIRTTYPDLYQRELRRTPVSWAHLRRMAHTRWDRHHRAAIRAARIRYLDTHPTPAGNRELARLMLTPSQFAALDKIADGGDGIGRGAPGESDWHHDVWNGGKLGHAGGPGPNAQSCGGGAFAYGIGQACPDSKMEAWAASAGYAKPWRIYDSPRLQILWARSYAEDRFGSLEAAGASWSITRSW